VFEIIPLSTKGKRLVQQAVKFCLVHGKAPFCSLEDGGTCTYNVISINENGLKNLFDVLNELM
jgi:hypothetical protein